MTFSLSPESLSLEPVVTVGCLLFLQHAIGFQRCRGMPGRRESLSRQRPALFESNHSVTASGLGLDHWVEQSALHRLLTPSGRRPWPPLPHDGWCQKVKIQTSSFQPDPFQLFPCLLTVFGLKGFRLLSLLLKRGADSEAAAHLPR